MKRINFSRLYFLSDDELLKILSNTKEPRNINIYLRKIFECMESLEFDEHGRITHMCSKEGEKIPFLKPVVTAEEPVEKWCKLVEQEMMDALREAVNSATIDYYKMARTEWALKWYGQCVLNCSQIVFTKETEDSIHTGILGK